MYNEESTCMRNERRERRGEGESPPPAKLIERNESPNGDGSGGEGGGGGHSAVESIMTARATSPGPASLAGWFGWVALTECGTGKERGRRTVKVWSVLAGGAALSDKGRKGRGGPKRRSALG